MGYIETSFESLLEMLKNGQTEQLRQVIKKIDPADMADFLEFLDNDNRDIVFKILDLNTASDVLAEMQQNVIEDIVEDLPSSQIADYAEQMAPDEAVEFLSDLEVEKSSDVLAHMEPEERQEIISLMSYKEYSAGRLMTPELLSLHTNITVKEAVAALKHFESSDPIIYIFVTKPESTQLFGIVSIDNLLNADPNMKMENLCNTDYVYSEVDEDQQDVALKFRKYDLWVMPVVDKEHRLVGRITADDIMDVVHEEADEDLAHLVGAPDIEDEIESSTHIARMRLPWLLITMTAGLVNSIIIKSMMDVTNIAAIAIFVPAILAMGGNTGMQSSAICIRGIALGNKKYGKLLSTMRREILVGMLLGITCGTLSAMIVFSTLKLTNADTAAISTLSLSLIVGVSMFTAMSFASSFGAVIPVILHRLKVDPAVASGPFITTSNDLSASVIYFLTCLLMLKIL